jgi:hypothetical protein
VRVTVELNAGPNFGHLHARMDFDSGPVFDAVLDAMGPALSGMLAPEARQTDWKGHDQTLGLMPQGLGLAGIAPAGQTLTQANEAIAATATLASMPIGSPVVEPPKQGVSDTIASMYGLGATEDPKAVKAGKAEKAAKAAAEKAAKIAAQQAEIAQAAAAAAEAQKAATAAAPPAPAAPTPASLRDRAKGSLLGAPPAVLPAIRELLTSMGVVRLAELPDDRLGEFVTKVEMITGEKL